MKISETIKRVFEHYVVARHIFQKWHETDPDFQGRCKAINELGP